MFAKRGFIKLAAMALIAVTLTVNTFAGCANGPRYGKYVLRPYATQSFAVTFRGGEYAEIEILGNGRTDLDLYVYNASGYLVAFDEASGDDGYIEFYVSRTATYKVVIVNHGGDYNTYEIATN